MTLYEGSAFLQESFTNTIPTSADVFAPAGTKGSQASRSDSVLLQNDSQYAYQAIFDSSGSRPSQYDDGRNSSNANYRQDNYLAIYGFEPGIDFIYNDATHWGWSNKLVAQQGILNGIDCTVVGETGDLSNPLNGYIYDVYYVFVDVAPEELGYTYKYARDAYTNYSPPFIDTSFGDASDLLDLADRTSPEPEPEPEPIRIVGNNKSNTLEGSEINNKIYGKGGNDTLIGNGGNDLLKGGGGKDILTGGAGKDKLFGDAGNDVLRGGGGNDLLIGGGGNDKLFGDGGKDTFRIQEGNGYDIIKDFTSGVDRIHLSSGTSDIGMTVAGGNIKIYGNDDLMAVVIGAASGLNYEGNYLV